MSRFFLFFFVILLVMAGAALSWWAFSLPGEVTFPVGQEIVAVRSGVAAIFVALLGALIALVWWLGWRNYTVLYAILGLSCAVLTVVAMVHFKRFEGPVRQRAGLVVRQRYGLYYALTFMSGARRQLFFAFGGFLLVKKFGYSVADMAMLMLVTSSSNTFFAPRLGRLVQSWGERNTIMLENSVLICVFIGYAMTSNAHLAAALFIIDGIFFTLILAQNERLARRFSELGGRDVRAVGNLKIDAPPPPVDEAGRARLEAAIGDRPLLVAASTHEGEEAILAEAHRMLAREFDGLVTLIAPRHPERGTGLAEDLKSRGFSVAQRSAGALPDQRTEIYIADTIGELGTFYAMSPVAFVGGSLVDRGGQNPIEAVRHGAAVITGPSWRNFADEYTALLKRSGAIEVRDAAAIADAIRRLARDAGELERMRAGAQAALAALSGALGLTVEALLSVLPAPADEGLRRAS